MEKIDVVIQGPYTDYTDFVADSYLKIPFVNKIIISCWKKDKSSQKQRRIKFVRNDYPFSPGTDNKNLQIVSSLNGLKKCKTNFAIKTRSDQKITYDCMMKMYDFFMQNKEKEASYQYDQKKPNNRILVVGINCDYLFAVRDHIFWGNTEDLIDLFDIPLEQNSLIDKIKVPKQRLGNYTNHFIRTETYIATHYCSNFDEEINRLLLFPQDHLHDGAIYWYYSKELSNNTVKSAFKSFPKDIIDLEWVKCKSTGFVSDLKHYLMHYSYHEDGY